MWLLLACTPEDTCEVVPPAEGALSVDGTLVRDSAGRQVVLRGVNAGGRSKFSPFVPFDYDDYATDLGVYMDRPAEWGATVLRVPFTWAALEPTQGTYDADWLERYDALLDAAHARGMWVIVDFHQDLYGEMYCGDGFPLWTIPDAPAPHHDCPDWFFSYLSDDDVFAAFDAFWADENGVRTAYEAMWAFMVDRYAEHPAVIGFEPFNEPHPGTMNGDTWAVEVLAPFYADMAAGIVARDPDALVFVDTTGMDAVYAETALPRPSGDSIVFAPHWYDAAVLATGGEPERAVEPELARWAAVGEAWQTPVLLGEFGVDPDTLGGAAFLDEHFRAFDTLGMHATWWEYSEATEAWNSEDLSMVEGDGTVHEELVAALARPFPRAIAGTDARWSWDGSALTLTYTADAGGVTEVRTPGGATVEVEGACADVRADRVYLVGTGAVTATFSP